MLILDTQVLLWLRNGDRRLGSRAIRQLEQAWMTNAAPLLATMVVTMVRLLHTS